MGKDNGLGLRTIRDGFLHHIHPFHLEHETALAFRQPLYNRVEKCGLFDVDARLHFSSPFSPVRSIDMGFRLRSNQSPLSSATGML